MLYLTPKKMTLAAFAAAALFLFTAFAEVADARSRSGGRSFKSPSQTSRQSTQAVQQKPAASPRGPMSGGSPLMRGLAGGIMGGVLGGLLFGGLAHGMGMGGLGGSGIGLFEILLMAGLAYAAFRIFTRKKALAGHGSNEATAAAGFFSGSPGQTDPEADPLVMGVKEIWAVYPSFDPEGFKETAQDLFFKVQAGWTRRDTAVLAPFVGEQLLAEYDGHFREMRDQGVINRLENIAVRSVDLTAAGVDGPEMFVTVRFLANLLDYTVDEATDRVVSGNPDTVVKFREEWTFAAPAGMPSWKLEGIES